MFFSNMLDVDSGTYLRNGGKSYPLNIEKSDKVSEQTVRVSEGELYVTNRDIGTNIFKLQGVARDVVTSVRGVDTLTYGDVADTKDNPLVVVATKGIKVYKDIPAYFNVLFVNDDMMIVALIYGACAFEFSDGTFVPLQRCDDTDLDRKRATTYFSCRELKDMTHCKTKGGWDKTYEMVCPILIRAKSSGDISVRCFKENAFVFNKRAITAAEEEEVRVAEEKKEAEERKKREREENLKRAEEARRLEAEEAYRKKVEEKINKKKERVSSKKPSTPTINDKGRNVGAEAFLAFLNGGK